MEYMAILGTDHGLELWRAQGDAWSRAEVMLPQHEITAVTAIDDSILAGTADGLYRSDDRGRNWTQVLADSPIRHVRWLAFHPDERNQAFAGMEPAAILRSENGGQSWQEAPEVAELRDQFGWFLPYSPGAGCIRGFAFNRSRVYAAAEVGGLLRSDDGGKSWRLASGSTGRATHGQQPEPYLHSDVHSIEVHPSSPDVLYAPTGGGFFRSNDGGKTWRKAYPSCYARAVWVDPTNPDRIVLGPADGVDRNGRIEVSQDGGGNWKEMSSSLASPWARHMVERFVRAGDSLIALLSNGRLLISDVSALNWAPFAPDVTDANAVAVLPLK